MNGDGGRAILENGSIVIRVSLDALPTIIEGAWATNNLTPRYKITNAQEFASDLVAALNDEDEEGSTVIHKMFDKAINEAIGNGAIGVEEHEQQEA